LRQKFTYCVKNFASKKNLTQKTSTQHLRRIFDASTLRQKFDANFFPPGLTGG